MEVAFWSQRTTPQHIETGSLPDSYLIDSAPTPKPPSTLGTTLELLELPVKQTVNSLGHRRTGSETKPGTLREEVEWREGTVKKQSKVEQDPPL